jgi:hypothetical protein
MNASSGTGGRTSGIVSGVASGASAGAAMGSVIPGVGTAIGAVVGGIVGGVGGFLSGKKADKSKYYQQLASQVQRQREFNELYSQQLQHVRGVRQARAQSVLSSALSGVQSGSLSEGATASIGSQSAYTLQTVGEDVRLQEKRNQYLQKAGKLQEKANEISQWTNLLLSGMQAYGSQMAEYNASLEQQQQAYTEQLQSSIRQQISDYNTAQNNIYTQSLNIAKAKMNKNLTEEQRRALVALYTNKINLSKDIYNARRSI